MTSVQDWMWVVAYIKGDLSVEDMSHSELFSCERVMMAATHDLGRELKRRERDYFLETQEGFEAEVKLHYRGWCELSRKLEGKDLPFVRAEVYQMARRGGAWHGEVRQARIHCLYIGRVLP